MNDSLIIGNNSKIIENLKLAKGMVGDLDNVIIYSNSLSDEDFTNLFFHPSNPPKTNIEVHWDFQEPSGNDIYNSSSITDLHGVMINDPTRKLDSQLLGNTESAPIISLPLSNSDPLVINSSTSGDYKSTRAYNRILSKQEVGYIVKSF